MPLSATTYYFKDIHDLITDAFTLYAKDTMENFIDPFWQRANEWLREIPASDVQKPEVQEQVVERLSTMGADYILNQLENHREQLHIEYAFLYAALLDERLHPLAQQYGQRLLANLTELLVFMKAREVELSAKAMLALIRRLEYEALVGMPGANDKAAIEQALRYQMRSILAY